jgi:crotonobetainyl-CoA:carnitine CoA-transferase CaiB-like acyl-CoA transferase
MSGLMSVTGQADGEPGGGPLRVGYSVADITAGFYAVSAILAALRHRDQVSGQGQHIDLALLDAQIGALSHVAMMYLVSGKQPPRLGNVSPITCPWQSFDCADGHIVIAVGNDRQFEALCRVLGLPGLASDPKFLTNPSRANHRDELIPQLAAVFRTRAVAHWYEACEDAGVPSGPIYDFAQVFDDPQVRHRGMRTTMQHPLSGSVPQVANPVRFSATPVQPTRPPPTLGEHTEEVLQERLGLQPQRMAELRAAGVV